MTIRDFLASLRGSTTAADQITGALAFDGIGYTMPAEDRAALVYALAKARKDKAK
jgi:hypothetical protein